MGGSNDPRLCSLISDDARYRGGNNEDAYDKQHNSLLGCVATSLSGPAFSAYARDRGEGWEAGWYVARAVQEYLYRIIMGTRNSQAAFNPNKDANGLYQGGLGLGATAFSNDYWSAHNNHGPFLKTSAGVELGDGVGISLFEVRNSSGQVIYEAKVPVFFGLKNAYGHVQQFTSGLSVHAEANRARGYVAPSMRGYVQSAQNVEGMSLAAELPIASGYIKRLSMHLLCGLPTEIGATNETCYCDSYASGVNYDTYGYNAKMSGGLGNHYEASGMHYARTREGIGRATSYTTSPLCYFEEDPLIT